tara:strand:+ start:22947 stop:24641 length:1695 start_codon:yes stop_codon:yes gene_type:complete
MADETTILNFEAKSNIKEVTQDVKQLDKSLKDTTKQTEQLKPATEKGAAGFKKVGIAIRAVGAAIKAIGIGLLISGFMALREAFMRNQVAADAMTKAGHFISIVFNEVVNIIVRLAQWIGENAEKFEAWKKVMVSFINLGWMPFKQAIQTTELAIRFLIMAFQGMGHFFGKDNIKAIRSNARAMKRLGREIRKTGDAMKDSAITIKDNWREANSAVNEFLDLAGKEFSDIDFKAIAELSEALTAAGKAAQFAALANETAAAKDKKAAEEQRQIRDDVSRSIEERVEANKKLGEILDEQLKRRSIDLAQERVAAELAVKANATDANKIALGKVIIEQLQLEEEITGQISEQLTNKVALEDELAENKKTLMEATTAANELEMTELDNWEAEMLRVARRTLADKEELEAMEVKIVAEAEKRKRALRAQTLNDQLGHYSKLAGALGALAGEQKEFALAQAIIDTYAAANAVLKDPTLVGPARWAAAAAAIVTGLANVKKIMETKTPGGNGGGTSVPTGGGMAPAPEMLSGSFTLGGGEEVEPARAYVVSDDITNNQNKLAIIRRRATI